MSTSMPPSTGSDTPVMKSAWFIFGHFWVTDGREEAAGR
jgi:hypothetical protein